MASGITEKRLAMLEVTVYTANSITKVLKDMPRTGKKRRNIFIKPYNRRPQNKKKRALVMAQVALTSCIGAMQMFRVMQTPIPKYPLGRYEILK